jgi:hypothetical protein
MPRNLCFANIFAAGSAFKQWTNIPGSVRDQNLCAKGVLRRANLYFMRRRARSVNCMRAALHQGRFRGAFDEMLSCRCCAAYSNNKKPFYTQRLFRRRARASCETRAQHIHSSFFFPARSLHGPVIPFLPNISLSALDSQRQCLKQTDGDGKIRAPTCWVEPREDQPWILKRRFFGAIWV